MKLWNPCGAAARRIGCAESAVGCPAGSFCASPADTGLGAPRCLPLPKNCGRADAPCCPANARRAPVELWIQDNATAVPFCEPGSFCLWQIRDYRRYGLAALTAQPGSSLDVDWDGYFDRGYGRSRCVVAAPRGGCGEPGAPCCVDMAEQRKGGMVHNRRLRHQPCNNAAAAGLGIYCDGAWGSSLLNASVRVGTCRLNTPDCGRVGKRCCREEVPGAGQLSVCEPAQRPGRFYCDGAGLCKACPSAGALAGAQLGQCLPAVQGGVEVLQAPAAVNPRG